MIQFDKKTIEQWKNDNVESISIKVFSSGCAWKLINIDINTMQAWYVLIENNAHIRVYVDPKNTWLFDSCNISRVWARWIVSSEDILHHCGCGKSFWLKTGDKKHDTLELLKAKLRKKRSKKAC